MNIRSEYVPKDGIIRKAIGYPRTELNPEGRPLQYQYNFHNSHKKYRLMSGGFGTGGTTALVIEVAFQLLHYPNNSGLLGRKDSVELEGTTLLELLDILPKETIARHDKSKRVITLWNGSRLFYTGLDNTRDAVDKIKSMNLGFACIDQLEEIDEDIFLAIQGRLRRAGTERCFFAKCNPEGHNWAWKRWVELPLDDYLIANGLKPYHVKEVEKYVADAVEARISLDKIAQTVADELNITRQQVLDIHTKNQYEYFGAITSDNVYLPLEYINELLTQYPDRWLKRYFYNSWDNFEGLVYSEYDERRNLETAYYPTGVENFIFGYDYGYRNPACILFGAVDYDGVLHIYDEWYAPETLIAEQAKYLKQSKFWKKATKIADPSITKAERDGHSVHDEWLKHDVWWNDANNDVRQGIDRVNQMLKDGKIKISKRCINLRREIGNYIWKQIKVGMEKNEYEEPRKKDDHAMDTLRYIVNYVFIPKEPDQASTARGFVDELYGDDPHTGEALDDASY